jgi:glycosyltransferase involved in cell wall biosynthesis
VIGTAVGGIPDVIEPEVTGLLIPPRDASALAAQLARLLDDSSLRSRLAAAAKADVNVRFAMPTMVEGYRAAYERALAGRTRASARRAGANPST